MSESAAAAPAKHPPVMRGEAIGWVVAKFVETWGHGIRALMGVASGGYGVSLGLTRACLVLSGGKDVPLVVTISNDTEPLPIPLGVDLV